MSGSESKFIASLLLLFGLLLTNAHGETNSPRSALRLTSAPGFYVVGDWPVPIDASGTVVDDLKPGAILTVSIPTNCAPEDAITIEPRAGTSLTAAAGAIACDGIPVGTFDGGNGAPLIVHLNTNITAGKLTDLIHALSFATTDASANFRQIQLSLACGDFTNTATRTLTLNRPPVANRDSFLLFEGASVTIPFSALLANDTDPDQDSLSISDVSLASRAGGHIQITETGLHYTPPLNPVPEDSFSYRLQDGRQGAAVGTVSILFVKSANLTLNR